MCRYGWLLLVKKLTFDGFRFWKNFLHESCRARWTEFVDIKYTQIGVRMKKLWYKEISLLFLEVTVHDGYYLGSFLTIWGSYYFWLILFEEASSFGMQKPPREYFSLPSSFPSLPHFLFLFFLFLLPLQTHSVRMVISPLAISGHETCLKLFTTQCSSILYKFLASIHGVGGEIKVRKPLKNTQKLLEFLLFSGNVSGWFDLSHLMGFVALVKGFPTT